MQNESQNSKEVQGTGTAQELQLKLEALLQENNQLKASNERLQDINTIVRDTYKLVASMNDFLRHDLECYKNGRKPTCSDAVYIINIEKGKLPRPEYLLHKENLLSILN